MSIMPLPENMEYLIMFLGFNDSYHSLHAYFQMVSPLLKIAPAGKMCMWNSPKEPGPWAICHVPALGTEVMLSVLVCRFFEWAHVFFLFFILKQEPEGLSTDFVLGKDSSAVDLQSGSRSCQAQSSSSTACRNATSVLKLGLQLCSQLPLCLKPCWASWWLAGLQALRTSVPWPWLPLSARLNTCFECCRKEGNSTLTDHVN